MLKGSAKRGLWTCQPCCLGIAGSMVSVFTPSKSDWDRTILICRFNQRFQDFFT